MKILSLGLDNSILNKNSALASRAVKYGNLVEKYTAIAPSRQNEKISLSEKAKACGSGGGNKLTQFFKIYQTAKKLLRQDKYQVITVQDQYFLALVGLCLSKKFKIGLEIQVHGFEKFYGLRKLIAQYVLPRADAIRGVSQRLKKQLVSQFGVPEGKITIVPIYLDTVLPSRDRASGRSNLAYSELNQRLPRRRSSLPAGRQARNDMGVFIFLTVGRLVPVKNIGMQIEAMREVIKKYSDTELWIVGDGSEKKNYERQIINFGLEKNIKLLGWQNDLAKYYIQAKAFVLTSDSEGWGLAVVEAAAAGLPIIMTDVGLAGEVIKDGESGLVIPVGDKEKLVEAMFKLMTDPALREKLAGSAKLAVYNLPTKEQTLVLYKKSWALALKNYESVG